MIKQCHWWFKPKKKKEAVFVVLHYSLQNVWIPNPRSNFSTHLGGRICLCMSQKSAHISWKRFHIGKLAKPNPRQPMAEVLQTCNH